MKVLLSSLVLVGPLIKDQLSHLPEGKVGVGEEVSHLTVGVVDVVEQVPLDGVVHVVPVAVDGGTVVVGHVPQLMSLKPDKITEENCLIIMSKAVTSCIANIRLF